MWILLALAAGCSSPERSLARPNAAALLPGGGVVVSDFHHQRLVELDDRGGVVRTWGRQGLGRGALWQVWGLAVDASGRVAVLNQRPLHVDAVEEVWEIKVFDRGRQVEAVVPPEGALGWAEGLAAMPDGSWLVADGGRGALVRMGPDFEVRGEWTAPRGGEGFGSPAGLRVAGDSLWVVEEYQHRVRRLSLDGEEQLSFGRLGSGPGELRFPRAVGVCPDRWVAVADLGNHRVQRFDTRGRYLDGFAPEPVGPDHPVQLMDLLVTPSCDALVLVDSKGGRVLWTTPEGRVSRELSEW